MRFGGNTLHGDALLDKSTVFLSSHLIWHLRASAIKRSLRVVVVQSNSESKLSHALVELIKNGEVSIDTIVLGNQLQKRHFNITEDDVITIIESHGIIKRVIFHSEVVASPLSALSEGIEFLLGTLDDVVANFEDGSLVFEVLEDFSVHLQRHFENLTEDRVQTGVENSSLILR